MPEFRARAKVFLAQNILWAAICVVLISIISALIATTNDLRGQNQKLQRELTAEQATDCVARDTWQPGTSRLFTVESSMVNRKYIVHLPLDFKADKNYPALLYFSRKGESGLDSSRHSGYDKLPAITIFPDPTIGKDGTHSWQGAPYSSGVDDVAFVNRLLDKVNGQLCIERSQIYAVGASNGGGLVALLSCRMPDRIRAFGMLAGAYYYPTSTCHPKKPAPIITIHGDSDQIVPYFGSAVRQLPDIDAWSTHRASQNSCKKRPTVSHQAAAIVTTWSNCRNDATVQSIRQIGVGHTWSEAERDTLWHFLSVY